MSDPIHRHEDSRVCGASTTVIGNDDVYANGKLVSVNGDPCSHGAGALTASSNEVYCHSKLVVHHAPDSAAADGLCLTLNASHCAPATAEGSPNVYTG